MAIFSLRKSYIIPCTTVTAARNAPWHSPVSVVVDADVAKMSNLLIWTKSGLLNSSLMNFLILLITNWFQPLVRCSLLDVFVEGQMLHPTVGGGPVPVFGSLGNLNNGPGNELYGGFAPFLIPAPAGYANKDLHLLMVNMPIVPATGLEGHVG